MGIWTKDNKTNQEVLDVPKTKAQLFVHMCDYLASRKIIEVDVTPRDVQNKDYGKKSTEEPAWRKNLATASQISYVRKLMVMCVDKAIPVKAIKITDESGVQVYTSGEASDHITILKEALGLS
jgi:hypothetical protein